MCKNNHFTGHCKYLSRGLVLLHDELVKLQSLNSNVTVAGERVEIQESEDIFSLLPAGTLKDLSFILQKLGYDPTARLLVNISSSHNVLFFYFVNFGLGKEAQNFSQEGLKGVCIQPLQENIYSLFSITIQPKRE